jgi:arylformamidase
MLAQISHLGKSFKVDLSKPIDISIPMSATSARAWYVDPIKIEPVRMGDWVGDVTEGGSVNFRNIFFNPHAHGTHTECVGHISKEAYSINQELKRFFFVAELVSVLPEQLENGDFVITKRMLEIVLDGKTPEALILRTVGNSPEKLNRNWSNTNPPYIDAEAMRWLVGLGVNHLLLDLPSVDKEVDGGTLAAHRAFWEYPENTQAHRTITELIFVPNEIYDGSYFLNLQIASFENDASPSKPILYRILS